MLSMLIGLPLKDPSLAYGVKLHVPSPPKNRPGVSNTLAARVQAEPAPRQGPGHGIQRGGMGCREGGAVEELSAHIIYVHVITIYAS